MQFCSFYENFVADGFCKNCLDGNGGCIVLVGKQDLRREET